MQRFHTVRAVLPSGGQSIWLVLDRLQSESIVREVQDYAMFLLGSDHSENTIRSYVPKIASFLNWADENAVDWRGVTLPDMARFKWFLEAPPAVTSDAPPPRAKRSAKTVNIFLIACLEFLRYCSRQGVIAPSVVDRLVEPRYLPVEAAGHDYNARRLHRQVRRREIRAREVAHPPKTLTQNQVDTIIAAASNDRDRFLFVLLDATAIRIGEALGLRRSDMHLLPDSTALGCEISGPHVHVHRRANNRNRALSKTRAARHVPVLDHVVRSYYAYTILRDSLARQENDYVFVNVSNANPGEPMTYGNAVQIVRRTGRRAGVEDAHPHLFRHTRATRWVEAGLPLDLIQELLGHASPASTSLYTHPSPPRLRAAITLGAGQLTNKDTTAERP